MALEQWPTWAQIGALLLLLLLSGFFASAETGMMALNRNRLKHLAKSGHRGANNTQYLLQRTDALLSLVLIGNSAVNTVVPVLTTSLAIYYFGNNGTVLSVATAMAAFLIIVFCEIAPKVVGATFPERIAFGSSHLLRPLMTVAKPVIWFVNLFVRALFKIVRIDIRASHDQRMSPEELRAIVLESSNYIPHKHHAILLNLFDLDDVAVDDVMTPRARIEMLDLSRPIEEIAHDLETCFHNQLPVFDTDSERVLGILHVRRLLSLFGSDALTHDALRERLVEPYYIPSGTPVFRQLQYFQENQQRLGLIVNEYGEVQGLVTLEDIIEEMIGEFTTSLPTLGQRSGWSPDGTFLADGGITLRELNRKLGLQLPTDGPRTLNGLILDALQSIPDNDVCVEIAGCRIEIVQIDHQTIRTARLLRPGRDRAETSPG